MPTDNANQWYVPSKSGYCDILTSRRIVTNYQNLTYLGLRALEARPDICNKSHPYVPYVYATADPAAPDTHQIIYRVDLRRMDLHEAYFKAYCLKGGITASDASVVTMSQGMYRFDPMVVSLDARDSQYLLFPNIVVEDVLPLGMSLGKYVRYMNRGLQTFTQCMCVTPRSRVNRLFRSGKWGKPDPGTEPLQGRAMDRRGYVDGKHRVRRDEESFQGMPNRVWKVSLI